MEQIIESPLWQRWEAYCQEVVALQRKLGNQIPPGKRERCEYRLRDLQTRLIPVLCQRLGR